MAERPFLLHALSPLHIGTGQAADIIDLPIARQRATGIPYVPGSAIKGVLRDARRPAGARPAPPAQLPPDWCDWEALFGPEEITDPVNSYAGALVAGDALLLAVPVRSFCGTFAWATSPLLLHLAGRDLPGLPAVTAPQPQHALVSSDAIKHGQKLYLEDLDLTAAVRPEVTTLADWLAGLAWPNNPEVLTQRFAVLDDETMTFLLETATQLDTRVRIKAETRAVAKGALWVEESLPPETLLVGLLSAEHSRRNGTSMTPDEALDAALPTGDPVPLQFGGKATIGRGRCEMVAV